MKYLFFIILSAFPLSLVGYAQEGAELGASWQYQNNYLEIVLFPDKWPENCQGFHVRVKNEPTGTETRMNKALMFLAIRKDREMADFSEDTTIAKLAAAAGNKRAERFGFDLTPEKLAAVPKLRPSLVGLCKEDPLLLYAAGLRVGKKLPHGEYTMIVEAEGKDGEKRKMLEKSFNTKLIPKPENEPDFSVKFSVKGFQTVESNFPDPYYEAHTAYWMFCGVNRASKNVSTFGAGAIASRNFSQKKSSRSIGDAKPDHYIFGIQTTDWFGNKDVYLKKNAGK